MAKIKMFGDAAVITSGVSLESLKKITKYNPKALTLMGGEDGKEPVFCVAVAKAGYGSLNAFSASFAPTTRDEEGKATITMTIPEAVTNAKDWAFDTFGAAVKLLNEVEAKLPEILAQVEADKVAFNAMIED